MKYEMTTNRHRLPWVIAAAFAKWLRATISLTHELPSPRRSPARPLPSISQIPNLLDSR
jgi:hypothetical protein